MTITQEIKLDIHQTADFVLVSAKQADSNSRYLKITLCDGEEELVVPAGAIVTLRALKPDGTSVALSGTRNSDGTVTVLMSNQVLAVEGIVRADVSTSQNGAVLSTATFLIRVGAVPIGTEIVSSNEFLQLTELYSQVSQLFPTDTTLSVSGKAADAKKVGDEIASTNAEVSDLKEDLEAVQDTMVYFDSEGYLCFRSLAN